MKGTEMQQHPSCLSYQYLSPCRRDGCLTKPPSDLAVRLFSPVIGIFVVRIEVFGYML